MMQSEISLSQIEKITNVLALKELVDTFSTLADNKDVQSQVLLFTENANLESYIGTQLVSSLVGRDQIGTAFEGFLSQFETVYHLNGQQTVEIDGTSATGISYCLVVLIGVVDGKRIKTTSGVSYKDVYEKQGSKWLISKRTSYFNWQERTELSTEA